MKAGVPAYKGRPSMGPVIFQIGFMMKFILLVCAAMLVVLVNSAEAEEIKTEFYTVIDGIRVDRQTMTGFRTWRAAACDRCHGANQEGMVGPSLVDSLKTLSYEEFILTVTAGRPEKGMPSFKENKQVTENIEPLYRYLKGRSNGHIIKAKVASID